MKKLVLFLIIFSVSNFCTIAQNRDLPSPSGNLNTLPAGSYIIAMDNTWQSDGTGIFNLKSYGLIVHLLNNNIKLKWVIKTGKAKDGEDFSGFADQILPALVTGVSSKVFKAGPFVIYPQDTTGVAAIVKTFYTSNGLTLANQPKVYKLTTNVNNVDIRYDMTGFRPKVLILNDGTKSAIHIDNMNQCAIPLSNYTVGVAIDLYDHCYNFASEPHNELINTTVYNAIKSFVNYGGNFLAQCIAITSMENHPSGGLQTTIGIDITNTDVLYGATVYPNADLAFSQYEGAFDIAEKGTVQNWVLKAGSSFINNEHNHTSGGTLAAQTPIGASVSKLTPANEYGGLVFYLGNHSFTRLTNMLDINGIRMYMNAMLTPAKLNKNCTPGEELNYVLSNAVLDFSVKKSEVKQQTELVWGTNEKNISHFIIERSFDGENFLNAGALNATELNANDKYEFNDLLSNNSGSIAYYRIKLIRNNGIVSYSDIKKVYVFSHDNILVQLFPNPAAEQINITIPVSWKGKRVNYEIVSSTGQVVKRVEKANSNLIESFGISDLKPGVYFVRLLFNETYQLKKFFKN